MITKKDWLKIILLALGVLTLSMVITSGSLYVVQHILGPLGYM